MLRAQGVRYHLGSIRKDSNPGLVLDCGLRNEGYRQHHNHHKQEPPCHNPKATPHGVRKAHSPLPGYAIDSCQILVLH
jgi:hypothetical protein